MMKPIITRIPRIGCWLIGALMLAAILWQTRSLTLPKVGKWLDVGQAPVHTDFVFLLNGGLDTRPFVAADLVMKKLADQAVITSTRPPARPNLDPKEHEVNRAILNRCGVPDAKIVFVDAQVDSTYDEAATLRGLIETHPDTIWTVVTNDYHTRRTRWVLQRVLGPSMQQVRIVSAPTDYFDADHWWQNEDGFVLYLSELLKASFYFIRYGNGIWWLLAAGLVWWLIHRYRTSIPLSVDNASS